MEQVMQKEVLTTAEQPSDSQSECPLLTHVPPSSFALHKLSWAGGSKLHTQFKEPNLVSVLIANQFELAVHHWCLGSKRSACDTDGSSEPCYHTSTVIKCLPLAVLLLMGEWVRVRVVWVSKL